MANNQMFGTTSKQFSLRAIQPTPQYVPKTSDEVNRLLGTVAQTAGQAEKIIDDKASTQLNSQYNQVQVEYNENMSASNGDLGKQTEAYATYYNKTRELMETPTVSEKVKNRFGAVALNDIGRIRYKHDVIRKKYNQDVFANDVAVDAITFKSFTPEEKNKWYKDKMEVGALYALSKAETSELLVTTMSNVNKASIDKDTPLEILETMKNDLEAVKKVDKKVEGKPYYVRAISDMDTLITKKKGAMEGELLGELSKPNIRIEESTKLIEEATYLPKDRKEQLKALAKNKEFTFVLNESTGNVNAQFSNPEVGLKTFENTVKNKMLLDTSFTKDEADSLIARKKKNIASAGNRGNSSYIKQHKNEAKSWFNKYKESKQYNIAPDVVFTKMSTAIGDGVIPESYQAYARQYPIGYAVEKTGYVPSFTELTKNGDLYQHDGSFYNDIADKAIGRRANSLKGDDMIEIDALAKTLTKTNRVGGVPTIFSNMLIGKDVETAQQATAIYDNYKKVALVVDQNEKLTDKLLIGDTKSRYYMFKAYELQNGGEALTTSQIKTAEELIASKENNPFLNLSAKERSTDLEYFTNRYSEGSIADLYKDREVFKALRGIGVSKKDATDMILKPKGLLVGDNYSMSGVEPDNPNYKNIEKDLQDLTEQMGGDDNTFYTVRDGMLYTGTKEQRGAINIGIPIESKVDANGNYIQMGLNDVLAWQRRWKEAYPKEDTFLGSKQGAQNLKELGAFLEYTFQGQAVVGTNRLLNRLEKTGKAMIQGSKEVGALIKKSFIDWNDLMHRRKVKQ